VLPVCKTINQRSAKILSRFFQHRSHDSRLALGQSYFDLLAALGNPQNHVPPVFHVAGTNGKGSTCAFLRSILEAEGYKTHVYTSPHLVTFHERIRLGGVLISEDELVDILTLCEQIDSRRQISDFEAATAAAFVAFARHPADFLILETGLGGRLDATNIIEKPLATLITRLSYDHRDYLGSTLTEIASEKAGIMRPGIPCFVSPQPEVESMETLRRMAAAIGAPLTVGTVDWSSGEWPSPGLCGKHQFNNAGLAITALSVLPHKISTHAIVRGLQTVEWPARLENLQRGTLVDLLPKQWELWLDGGHNDSAGEVLAVQCAAWQAQEAIHVRPLYLVFGMLQTKFPHEFLKPLLPYVAGIRTLTIPDTTVSYDAEKLAEIVGQVGVTNVVPEMSVPDALKHIAESYSQGGRILICGSLYLAGHVLDMNGQ
jgi:dihydrofolate synthase / folylpolyglutamate synthase